MDTLNFLQRVLPSSGFYVAAVFDENTKRQGFFSTIDELLKAITSINQRGLNTYYAISSFIKKGSRKQDNVQATKVIALDIDAGNGKPYASWKDGLCALGKFIQELNIPKPLIIHSGNGLHVYWVLTEELEPTRWRPLAEAMYAAVKHKNLRIDPGAPPTDSARVFRPVGTTNFKSSTKVRILIDAPPVTVEELTAALSEYINTKPTKTNSPLSPLTQALQVQQDIPLANGDAVVGKCQQIRWGVKNQEEVKEPFWYAMLGVAAYCKNSEEIAITWSNQYPGFNKQETLKKLEHWAAATTGPTTCKKFAELRPNGCNGCKFQNKIGTPARLGVQYTEIPAAKDVSTIVDTSISLPKPFKRTSSGIKVVIDGIDVDVCSFDIYPVSYGKDEGLGYEVVRYYWNRPHMGWQELVFRQALLTDGHKDFATAIADQGIVLNSKNQTAYFQAMLRAYMNELRQKRAMTNLYSTMGWKEDFTQFVIGNTLLRRNADGSVSEEQISLAINSGRLGGELWNSSGSLEAWIQFTSLVEKADLRAHAFALAVGLSAPLYAFTGLKGTIVSLYGPTGSGKSLAQLWVQSIYGDPEKLHFSAKFTQNSLFNRMGLYSHMPMTVDEVTIMKDEDVCDFAYWVSQGRDKVRLTRSAEERDAKTWAMPVIVSTNKSISSKLVNSKLDTEAQAMRILEVNISSSKIFTKDSIAGRKIYEFITTNYGHAGKEFIKKLLEIGPDGIRAMIAEATNTFRRRYKAEFSGEERFWEQTIVLADLAAQLAKEWGIITFNHKNGIEWVLAQIGAIRRTVADLKLDAFDLLSEYLNENVSAQIQVFHTGTQKPMVDHSRLPRGEVRVRFDFYRKTSAEPISHGILLIDRTHLRRWLAQRGADYRSFMQEFMDEEIICTPKSNKAYLAKDTPIKLSQSYVIGLKLNHPRLYGILSDADDAVDNIVYGQLKVVT